MRTTRLTLFLAASFGVAVAVPLAAHDLAPNNHPGMIHFHIRGIVRNGPQGSGPGVAGVTVGYYGGAVVQKGVFPNQKPVSQLQAGQCSAEASPVTTAGDGTFDFIVFFKEPACEASIKDAIRSSWGAQKQGWYFKPTIW
jgi:hypothetical protein